MLDLYGNCTAIEMVDMRRSLNNFAAGEAGGGGVAGEEEEEGDEEAESEANNRNSQAAYTNIAVPSLYYLVFSFSKEHWSRC